MTERRGIQAIRCDLSLPQTADGHEILMARRKKRAWQLQAGRIDRLNDGIGWIEIEIEN